MKRFIIITFIITCAGMSMSFGQKKKISQKKLHKYFVKGKYEKGLEYIRKFNSGSNEILSYKTAYLIQKSRNCKTSSFQQKYMNQGYKIFLQSKVRDYINANIDGDKKGENDVNTFIWDIYADFTPGGAADPASGANPSVMEKEKIGSIRYFYQDSTMVLIDSLRQIAKLLVGIPYKYGGDTTTGFDCSGFTQYVFRKLGVKLPHNANMQSKLGEVIPLDSCTTGDMVFFGSNNRAYHAGMIYNNSNRNISIIHCISKGVTIDTEQFENYWKNKILCVRRILF